MLSPSPVSSETYPPEYDEVEALQKIVQILGLHPPEEQHRIVRYLIDRYVRNQ